MEKALPRSVKSLGLTDLAPWTGAAAVIRHLDGLTPTTEDHRQARADLLAGMARLAEGHHQFHQEHKVSAFVGARSAFCHALARVSFVGLDSAAREIETEVLPPLAGLIRWAERLPAD